MANVAPAIVLSIFYWSNFLIQYFSSSKICTIRYYLLPSINQVLHKLNYCKSTTIVINMQWCHKEVRDTNLIVTQLFNSSTSCFNPLRLILIFTHMLFMKSHYSGFCTCMCLMPCILYTKYPTQKWISPFCSAEKRLSSNTKFFVSNCFFP